MSRKLLIQSDPYEVRIAVLEDERPVEVSIERHSERGQVGNIYRGRVARVLPGIQAAFVDIGLERHAFLYVGDVRDQLADLAEMMGGEEVVPAAREGNDRNIEELLSQGQELMVQVRKDPLPNKGARVTTQIALPGRYLVLLPTTRDNGVSRRIDDGEERERLLAAIEELGPVPGGLIVRTAGEGRGVDQLARDLDYLSRLWRRVAGAAEEAAAPARVHRDLDLARRTVRDLLDESFEVVWVDGEQAYAEVLEEVEAVEPDLADRVRAFAEPGALFSHFGVERVLTAMLKGRIWLKSGGYLIIQQTEALVSIDVNTGRFVGRSSLEETVLRANLEAVEEVARQIRLRDLGGIIVVDFIDMVEAANRQQVFEALEQALARDRARTQLSRISEFGLVEITRKRSRSNPRRVLTRPCPCCRERGRIKSVTTVCLELRRQLVAAAAAGEPPPAAVRLHPEIADALGGPLAAVMAELEQLPGGAPRLEPDPDLRPDRYELVGAGQVRGAAS